jgi:hypothetical protein
MDLTSLNHKLSLENSGRMSINHNPLQLYTPHNNFFIIIGSDTNNVSFLNNCIFFTIKMIVKHTCHTT